MTDQTTGTTQASEPFDLSGRVALVTGSSSGIGEATARKLSALGARVMVNSASSVEAGRSVAESLPGEAAYAQADISDGVQGERLIAETIDQFGALDILVNNAGWTSVVAHDDLDALTDDIFDKTFDVNVSGTWKLTKAAMPWLRQSSDPNVVTITSIAGVRPVGSSIAYAMSKAALNHMTVLMARSHGPVRFNAVAPGLVDTPWTADWDDIRRSVQRRSPLSRTANPQDCADAVASLISARYVTGQVLVVDGGLTIV